MYMLARRSYTLVAKVIIELMVVAVSFSLALYLRFDGNVPPVYTNSFLTSLALIEFSRLVSIAAVTRHRLQWHSTSLEDFLYLFVASVAGTALFVALRAVLPTGPLPRSVIVFEWAFSLYLITAAHVLARVLWNRSPWFGQARKGRCRRVLVVGAGDAGQRITRAMKEDKSTNLVPVGFVDDDPKKLKRLIQGVPVLGNTAEVPALIKRLRAEQVLIAIPSLSPGKLNRIVQQWAGVRVEMTILPGLPEMLQGKVGTNLIRKVRVEDLLERTPVRVDMDSIASYLEGQRVLVTGAGGSIGAELCRQIMGFRPEQLILLGQGEHSIFWIEHELRNEYQGPVVPVIADIKDRIKLEAVFRAHRPTVVFHAAAHKHVPLMESNPEEAIKNNVFGTRNLAELSIEHGVRQFVMISTDKAVNPTSVMGASKRVAEMLVQSFAQRCDAMRRGDESRAYRRLNGVHAEHPVTEFACVRFGNVLGSRGSVIPTMQRQIEKGGPVTVTHPDMVRYFMTIPEAVQLVIQAGAMGGNGCIFVLDMGKPVKILDLATNLIQLSGLVPNEDIRIEFTGPRPGEKLYEEVLTAEEGITVTSHEKIFTARAAEIDHVALHKGLSRLEYAVRRCDGDGVRSGLERLLPAYRPGNAGIPPAAPAPAAAPAPPVPRSIELNAAMEQELNEGTDAVLSRLSP